MRFQHMDSAEVEESPEVREGVSNWFRRLIGWLKRLFGGTK